MRMSAFVEAGAYMLDFQGRVTMASVKNVQLVEEGFQAAGKHAQVLLQFGRTGKDSFTLDFKYPLSPLQAFGIALAKMHGQNK